MWMILSKANRHSRSTEFTKAIQQNYVDDFVKGKQALKRHRIFEQNYVDDFLSKANTLSKAEMQRLPTAVIDQEIIDFKA